MNISLAPGILFEIAGFPVTNTLLWTVILSLVLIVLNFFITRKMKLVPRGLQNLAEVIFEGAWGFVKSTVGNEKKAKKLFPLVFTMFIFILITNIFTFLPGAAAVEVHKADGTVPLFRAVMSDYGMVLIMTLITIITAQIVAIAVHGPFGYIGKFINLKGVFEFFKLLSKGKFKPAVLAQGFLDLFLGVMDIVGEVAKILSLSFRLFGNMFAGEVLTIVMLSLAKYIIPLPFMFLGLITAFVQAFVFAVLTLVFINMASEIDENELVEQASI